MTYFRERLWPSAWIYLALGLVIPASLLVFLQINQLVGAITAAVLYLSCAGFFTVTAPVVSVTDTHITAGRAALPLKFVGVITTHDGADATLERGQRLDARAWLLIRGWVAPIAKIEVTDPEDPAPYWVVSTRRPTEFVKAVSAAQAKASSGAAD